MGDPAGVGPEIMLHALNHPELSKRFQLIVFGSQEILNQCHQRLFGGALKIQSVSLREFQTAGKLPSDQSMVVDDAFLTTRDFEIGRVSKACGEAAYRYIDNAIRAVQADLLSAVTTGPINKESMHLAGYRYPGHTEIFAERDGSNRWCMLQYSPTITCSFVTVHCGYAQVPELLSVQRVLDTIELTAQALTKIRRRPARIVVCGLNPHAGEHGLFGDGEEERIIAPAIQQAQRAGLDVEGPLPPDTVFIPQKLNCFDAAVCMYHDQGHIPLKALAFDSAVNTTLGLKIVRTSVDHGTAFDIAWKGIAKPDSLFAAIELAGQLAAPGFAS